MGNWPVARTPDVYAFEINQNIRERRKPCWGAIYCARAVHELCVRAKHFPDVKLNPKSMQMLRPYA